MRERGRAKLNAQYALEGRVPEVYGELRTHCRNGHEYAVTGVEIKKQRDSTTKVCVVCRKDSLKRYNEARKTRKKEVA